MSSAMLMDRAGLSFQTPTLGGQSSPGTPTSGSWCVVPRCTLKFEKCAGGLKIHCKCDDAVSCATLQNLCNTLSSGTCSCCCTCNGIACCACNLCCGLCKCECTKDGVCISCTSGDKACCDMLQSCCDCLSCLCKSGCCCYVCFGGVAVCCGCC
jgi:hypothetical protein